MKNHFELGKEGEKLAAKFLKKQGFFVLEKNLRLPQCEIDIICTDKKVLRFVEVKTRSSTEFANPREAVDFKRRQNYRRAGEFYVKINNLQNVPLHFDIIEVVGKEITYLPDDF